MSNIITREEALNQGLSRYRTGKACKHGHVAERSTVSGSCTECHRLRQAVRNKFYDHKAPRVNSSTRGQRGLTTVIREDLRARGKKWQLENPERTKEIAREYYKANKEPHNDRATNNRLIRNLGITKDQYDKIMREHDGRCDICGTDIPGGPHGSFNLDHDHATGELRGVLCMRCNTSLGKFEDRIDLLQAAINYLQSPPLKVS